MEVKNSGQNTHIFITIGEIMLRLTLPTMKKSEWPPVLRQATAEVKQTLRWRLRTLA